MILAKPVEWGVGPQPVKVNDRLSDKVEIPVGGTQKVIAVAIPGHTPGSYAYYYEGVLFVGDSLRFSAPSVITRANCSMFQS